MYRKIWVAAMKGDSFNQGDVTHMSKKSNELNLLIAYLLKCL